MFHVPNTISEYVLGKCPEQKSVLETVQSLGASVFGICSENVPRTLWETD